MPAPASRPRDVDFGGPATYRIVVQGALSESWSGRLADLAITTTSREGGAPHTTLVGPLLDQAQLSGVLDTLHGLHLSILKVERLEDENGPNGPADHSETGPERRS
jgi:hypothetical protein